MQDGTGTWLDALVEKILFGAAEHDPYRLAAALIDIPTVVGAWRDDLLVRRGVS